MPIRPKQAARGIEERVFVDRMVFHAIHFAGNTHDSFRRQASKVAKLLLLFNRYPKNYILALE